MFYEALAEEFFEIRAKMIKFPKNRQMSKAIQGEQFVLEYLTAHQGMAHPKELSQAMAVSSARIARLLNHMEEKMLIVRRADGHDNRQTIVALTETGQVLGIEQHELTRKMIVEMLEMLGDEDARNFIRILKKIANNFEQHEEKADRKEPVFEQRKCT